MFADEGERVQLRRWGAGGSDQRQVDLTGVNSFNETIGVVLDQGDLDPRVSAMERSEDFEQRGDGARGDHADAEPASHQTVYFVDGLAHGVDRCQHGPSVRERRRACGGQAGLAT